ncbi:unnamed protein product [Calypogeia fissa]
MRGLEKKINQKVAFFLGDYQDQRTPIKDPSPHRAIIRIVFLGFMLIVFVALLIYYFKDSPDVRVEQVQQLGPGEKHHNVPISVLYDRTPIKSDNGTFNLPLFGRTGTGLSHPRVPPFSCPCTITNIHWRQYVKFYALTQNSTNWNLTWSSQCNNSLTRFTIGACVKVPPRNDDTVNLLQNHIVVDRIPLDANPGSTEICDSSTLWNASDDVALLNLTQNIVECYWLASMLFDANGTSVYSETKSTDTKSTDILETPMLLDRETFFTNVAESAREAVLKRRLRLNELNPTDEGVQKYYDGVADYLTELLDRGELDEYWQSFYEGAYYLQETVDVSIAFEPSNTLVFYVGDNDTFNPAFLHAEVDWLNYYDTCAPQYCERTKNLKPYNHVVWVFATLGGLSTIVVAVATRILWPAIARFMHSLSNRSHGPIEAKVATETDDFKAADTPSEP